MVWQLPLPSRKTKWYQSTLSVEAKAFLAEHQTHASADPSDEGGDIEVKQLRSGSCHYCEGRKTQTHKPASSSPPQPLSIAAEPSWSIWDTSGSAALLAVSGCRGQHWNFTGSEPHYSPYSPTGVVP